MMFIFAAHSSIKLSTNYFVFFAIYVMSVIYDLNLLKMENIGSYISNSNSPGPRPTNSERVTSVHNTFVMSWNQKQIGKAYIGSEWATQ